MTKAILGIDVSKKEISLALKINESYKKFKVSNDLKGFKELNDRLKKKE